jgi:energy-coupling factor transport system ATP-binding protein
MQQSEVTPALSLAGVTYAYPHTIALAGVDLTVPSGSYFGIVGPNGSGKTTLAYLIAGVLEPTSGSVDTHGNRVGLVLSNPANQIVSLVVEEDVAFGPENQGLPPDEIERRVEDSLSAVHCGHLRRSLTSGLSGGQLAKVVHAGQLAMDVDVLVLDEGTAMLDPASRQGMIALVTELNRKLGTTVIHITHRLEDLAASDTVIVMAAGRIVHRAPDVLTLARMAHELEGAGIEAGPELVYRCFLHDLGIDEPDLRRATATAAGLLKGRAGM